MSCVKRGYLYQGQWYSWQAQPRGSYSLDLGPRRFVHYLQTHDQVANTFRGRRLHELTSPGRLRALTALLLLSPPVPQLFQGQEFAASSPFHYFADHEDELAEAVRAGRTAQVGQFRSLARAMRFEGMARPMPEPRSSAAGSTMPRRRPTPRSSCSTVICSTSAGTTR